MSNTCTVCASLAAALGEKFRSEHPDAVKEKYERELFELTQEHNKAVDALREQLSIVSKELIRVNKLAGIVPSTVPDETNGTTIRASLLELD